MTMHVMKNRPACFVEDDSLVTARGEVTEGWPLGVKPGLRNPFHDAGRGCGAASTPELWADTLRHTSGCAGCARARRALEVAAGISGQYDAPFSWKDAEPSVPWYERYFRLGAA
jgi:hypothetical protein